MFLGCLPHFLSRTPARRRDAGRGLWHPNLITSTPTKFGTEVGGPRPVCLCSRCHLPSPEASLCRFPKESRRLSAATGAALLCTGNIPRLQPESANTVFIDEVGALTSHRALCGRVSVGLALQARLPFRRGAKGNTAGHFALFQRESSATHTENSASLTKRSPFSTSLYLCGSLLCSSGC